MPKLYYQGHGSYRLTSANGRVIYVDPYAGEGYDIPADIILVTHQHGDHNQIKLCTQKPDCRIITNVEALEGGKHNSFDIGGITIQAVEASNKNHDPKQCVGYIITIDEVKIYAGGDTSKTAQMETFADMELDYAILPGDGVYNMNPEEASQCARLIKAKHNIIVHLKPGELFDREKADAWSAPNKLIIKPNDEISLKKCMCEITIVNMQTLNLAQRTQAAQILTDELPQGWTTLADALDEITGRVENIERDRRGESIFLAAIEREEVLGWIGALPAYGGCVYELHPMVVRRDRQRQGIGTMLVRELEETAKERGGLTLYLGADDEKPGGETSLANRDLYADLPGLLRGFEAGTHQTAFYLKLGFKIVGVIPDANGVGKPDIFMAKRL